jgi:hypothetical protein
MPHLKFMDILVHRFKHLFLLVVYPFLQTHLFSLTSSCLFFSCCLYRNHGQKYLRSTPFQCTSVFPPTLQSSRRQYFHTNVGNETFRHRQTFCAGCYTPEGIRNRQRVGSVYPWHFFLFPLYRLSSCHLFFFLIYFHIHAYNLLRP